MSSCDTCLKLLGIRRSHGGGTCVVRQSLWCSQCSCYGHRAADCDEVCHVERPRTLEELIPADVRERWDIDTATPIQFHAPTFRPLLLEEKEREIADGNTIEIRGNKGSLDRKVREFMKKNKIDTVHKFEGNLQLVRQWAVGCGKKMRIVQEK